MDSMTYGFPSITSSTMATCLRCSVWRHLRQSAHLKVVEPEAAVSDYTVPVTDYYSWTLPPGLPPRWVQPHLELLVSTVISMFR
jgi:hypothetical protein